MKLSKRMLEFANAPVRLSTMASKEEAIAIVDGVWKDVTLLEWQPEVAQLEDKLSRLDVEMLTIDDDGNPVGCGMDLLDWQAHLQTELGITHLKIRQLETKNERLRDLFRAGHEMDEGRTWFWDDDIVKVLRGK